jgi:hypothetical protein
MMDASPFDEIRFNHFTNGSFISFLKYIFVEDVLSGSIRTFVVYFCFVFFFIKLMFELPVRQRVLNV